MLEPLLWFCKTFLPLRAAGSSLFQLPKDQNKEKGNLSNRKEEKRMKRSGCGLRLTISENVQG